MREGASPARGARLDRRANGDGARHPARALPEIRNGTPLPHYLVERFALIVGREVEFVLTGKVTEQRAPLSVKRLDDMSLLSWTLCLS
jgi:hypothetical protein